MCWLWASLHLTRTKLQSVNVDIKTRFLKIVQESLNIKLFLLNWSKFLPYFREIHLNFQPSLNKWNLYSPFYTIPSTKLVSRYWMSVRMKAISLRALSKITRGSWLVQRRQLGAITIARLLASIFVCCTTSLRAKICNKEKPALVAIAVVTKGRTPAESQDSEFRTVLISYKYFH